MSEFVEYFFPLGDILLFIGYGIAVIKHFL